MLSLNARLKRLRKNADFCASLYLLNLFLAKQL
jgi:hypothetical protein